MKIAFWSPVPGQAGTTGNMLAVAVMSSMILKKNTLLLHNHFGDKSLEKAVLGKDTGTELFENIGLDSLIRNIKISELSHDIIHNSSLSLYNNRLHILPGTTKENRHLYETELSLTLPAILRSADKFYDMVFLDMVSGYEENSKKYREECDLIVVNLTQNRNMINDYFLKYHLPEEKTIYLIGKYNPNSRYNLTNLERCFHMLKNKTGIIPYNVEFMDAAIDGKIMNYFIKTIINGKGEANLYFIKKVKKAAALIFDRLVKAGGRI